jgi:hypothetical protein
MPRHLPSPRVPRAAWVESRPRTIPLSPSMRRAMVEPPMLCRMRRIPAAPRGRRSHPSAGPAAMETTPRRPATAAPRPRRHPRAARVMDRRRSHYPARLAAAPERSWGFGPVVSSPDQAEVRSARRPRPRQATAEDNAAGGRGAVIGGGQGLPGSGGAASSTAIASNAGSRPAMATAVERRAPRRRRRRAKVAERPHSTKTTP